MKQQIAYSSMLLLAQGMLQPSCSGASIRRRANENFEGTEDVLQDFDQVDIVSKDEEGFDVSDEEETGRIRIEAKEALLERYRARDGEERKDRLSRWGILGSDLVDVQNHFADTSEPYDKMKDTAFFFMIPKSGTTTLGSYMTNCVDDLVTGNGVGKLYDGNSDKLEVVIHYDQHKYLNVDVTKRDGLDRAYELGLAESAMADVIITGFPIQVASIFNSHNKARMFTLMRHPFQRIISEFYYVRIAEWEQVSYKPWLKDWTLEQYVASEYSVDNFITRQLVGKTSTDVEITMKDVENARHILTEKCLIGLTKEYKETLLRFKQYFGWEHNQHCFENLFQEGGMKNTNEHPTITLKRGTSEYEALLKHDKYDLMLWQHAVQLFEEQGKMFKVFEDQ